MQSAFIDFDGLPVSALSQVRRWFKRFVALCLLPPALIDEVAMLTMESSPDLPAVIAFQEYYVTTYLDDDATFPRGIWNHWDTYGPRTTNHVEGWNSKLNRAVGYPHPNIYVLVEILRTFQDEMEDDLEEILYGGAPPQPSKAVRDKEERYANLKAHYANGHYAGEDGILRLSDALSFLLKPE